MEVLLAADAALAEGVKREDGEWALERIAQLGRLATGPTLTSGEQADKHRPELRTHRGTTAIRSRGKPIWGVAAAPEITRVLELRKRLALSFDA